MNLIQSTILGLFVLLNLTASSQSCSSAGPRTSAAVSNNAATGIISWTNLSNTQLVDNSYASAGSFLGVLGSANSNYIMFKNFGFAIPPGAAICGIEVTRVASVDGLLIGSSVRDNDVRIIKNNTITGLQHASGVNWTASNGSATWGGNADDWGISWTAADINSADFGVAVSVRMAAGLASLFLTAKIEALSITVYYNLILSLKLESFTAKTINDKIHIEWTTDPGNNSQYFVVQRSGPQQPWVGIDTVHQTNAGNLSRHYKVLDEKVNLYHYYRLLQVATDGSTAISQVISLKTDAELKTIKVYPNPANRHLYIHDDTAEDIKLFYPDGRLIPVVMIKTAGNWRLQLPVLSNGIYLLLVLKPAGLVYHRIQVMQ